MRIDMHAHYVPPRILQTLERHPTSYGVRLEDAAAGTRCLHFNHGLVIRPFFNRASQLSGYLTILALAGSLALSLWALSSTLAEPCRSSKCARSVITAVSRGAWRPSFLHGQEGCPLGKIVQASGTHIGDARSQAGARCCGPAQVRVRLVIAWATRGLGTCSWPRSRPAESALSCLRLKLAIGSTDRPSSMSLPFRRQAVCSGLPWPPLCLWVCAV
jgi:hypothetical protein